MADTKLVLTIATTGLREYNFRPEIIQFILASSEGCNLLVRCTVPTGAIQQEASKFNGYTIRKRESGKRALMRHGRKVKTVALKQAIHDLFEDIEAQSEQAPGGRIILMAIVLKRVTYLLLRMKFESVDFRQRHSLRKSFVLTCNVSSYLFKA